jgi:hypothetical protein
LFEFLIFLVLPILIDIFLVKVVFFRRDKWSLNFAVPKIVPWKIFEPRMVFYLTRAIEAKPVSRLSLYHLVNKVRSLH